MLHSFKKSLILCSRNIHASHFIIQNMLKMFPLELQLIAILISPLRAILRWTTKVYMQVHSRRYPYSLVHLTFFVLSQVVLLSSAFATSLQTNVCQTGRRGRGPGLDWPAARGWILKITGNLYSTFWTLLVMDFFFVILVKCVSHDYLHDLLCG